MTLTELKYIVAVARERHFGKAAEACYVSQPTLSVAIKKLEDELEVKLFERSAGEVTVTPLGEQIVQQAQSVLDQAASIKEIAKRGKDPLAGPLNLGVIYTIGPYLLPDLVRQVIARTPQMPLVLQENFTAKLLEMLRAGEIDCAIMAEPFPDAGLAVAPLYDEPFMIALPAGHPLAAGAEVGLADLPDEPLVGLPEAAGSMVRSVVVVRCQEAGFLPRFVQSAPDSWTCMALVSAGVGLHLTTASAVEHMPLDGIVVREVAGDLPPVSIHLIRLTDDDPVLRRVLRTAARALPGPAS